MNETFPIDPTQLAAVAIQQAVFWQQQAIRWEAAARTLKLELDKLESTQPEGSS